MSLDTGTLIEAFEKREAFSIETTALTLAEDALVRHFLPPHDKLRGEDRFTCISEWKVRPPVIDLIKGPDFAGRLVDVSIERLEEEEEFSALLRSGVYPHKLPQDLTEFRASVLGLTIVAGIRSSNPTIKGTIERSMWLVRKPFNSARLRGQLWGRYVGPDVGQNNIVEVAKSLAAGPDFHLQGAIGPRTRNQATTPRRR